MIESNLKDQEHTNSMTILELVYTNKQHFLF